jgi:ribose 1,5-bisphosphokinase
MGLNDKPSAMPEEALPVTGGALVAVVGPSGAGKDTLLNYACREFEGDAAVFFVRRVITRPPDGATEDHVPATTAEFDAAERTGAFAFTWQAHGLKYGLPIAIDERIRAGHTAVCNGSRAALHGLRARYANFAAISITAHREVLANRLAARGRESREDILERLGRGAALEGWDHDALQIDNSGAIEVAGAALVAAIRAVGKE